MDMRHTLLCIAMGSLAGFLQAQDVTQTPPTKLLIEPSSTQLPLAKADLTVGPLESKEQSLCGTYKIKVTPFAFKNDHGNITLAMSTEDTEKMSKGKPVDFTGKATSAKDGKIKPIKGKTKPDAGNHGDVSFVVTTEDGDLLFNTTYRIESK